MNFKLKLGIFITLLSTVFSGTAFAQDVKAVAAKKKPVIQLAILLDTSNSMDGLLGQAKAKLWRVVNELATAKQGGKNPEIYVAIYEYGNDRLSSENGFVHRVLALTDDLDKVSEQLFALRTNGGSEYCGHVIKKAVSELKWDAGQDAYKTIFIAGNESFAQGSTDYRTSCASAIKSGITVNTIFCGRLGDSASAGWAQAAKLADGHYLAIDQNRVQTQVKSPYDKEISRLNGLLNKTYVPFGNVGRVAAERQKVQDSNASGVGQASTAQRARWKASKNYRCDSWDLVDAVTNKKIKLSELKADQLPAAFRKLSPAERSAKIEALLKERRSIQKKIQNLDAKRRGYVSAEMKKLNKNNKDSLDNAMLDAAKKQAGAKKFKFGE